MSLQELFHAMNMFKQGVQEFGVARGISNAQEQINELNAAQLDEMEKRNALQGIANNLALNMSKMGAPVSQIQSAVGAVAPQAIKSADDAILQGAMAGERGKSLLDVGQQANMAQAAPEFENQRRQQTFQASENAKNRQVQLEIAGLRTTGKLKPLSDKEIDFVSGLEDDVAIGESLINDITKSPWLTGPAAGRIPGRGMVDPKYAEFKQQVQSWFDQYRSRITGAGASDTELERIKKSRPMDTDTPKQFAAKVRAIQKVAQAVRDRRLKNLERAGRDVRRFDFSGKGQDASVSPETSAAATPPVEEASTESTKMKIKLPAHWLADD